MPRPSRTCASLYRRERSRSRSPITRVERFRSRSPVHNLGEYVPRVDNIFTESDQTVLMRPNSYESSLQSVKVPFGFNHLEVEDKKITVSGAVPEWVKCLGTTATFPDRASWWMVKFTTTRVGKSDKEPYDHSVQNSWVRIGYASHTQPQLLRAAFAWKEGGVGQIVCRVDPVSGKYTMWSRGGCVYQLLVKDNLLDPRHQFVPYIKMRQHVDQEGAHPTTVEVVPVPPFVIAALSDAEKQDVETN